MRETSAGTDWDKSPNGRTPPSGRVMLLCLNRTPESMFGDVPDLDAAAAIRFARKRIERRSRRPSNRG